MSQDEDLIIVLVQHNHLYHTKKIANHAVDLMKHRTVMENSGRRRPNVVFIVTESLSGYAQDSPVGRQHLPFFYQQTYEGFSDWVGIVYDSWIISSNQIWIFLVWLALQKCVYFVYVKHT